MVNTVMTRERTNYSDIYPVLLPRKYLPVLTHGLSNEPMARPNSTTQTEKGEYTNISRKRILYHSELDTAFTKERISLQLFSISR